MHKILLTSLRKHKFFLTHRRIFFWYFIVLHNYIATEIMSFYFSLMPKYINWKEIVIWNKQFYIHFSAVCVLESNFRRNIYWTGHCNSRPTSINYEVEFYQRIDETNIHERISLKICQDVNWMRVTFFLPPKSWAAGSVKKSDCDLWGPGLIDLDRLSVIKWSHQCQHWHSKRTRCQSNFLLLYTIGISWSTRILKD